MGAQGECYNNVITGSFATGVSGMWRLVLRSEVPASSQSSRRGRCRRQAVLVSPNVSARANAQRVCYNNVITGSSVGHVFGWSARRQPRSLRARTSAACTTATRALPDRGSLASTELSYIQRAAGAVCSPQPFVTSDGSDARSIGSMTTPIQPNIPIFPPPAPVISAQPRRDEVFGSHSL